MDILRTHPMVIVGGILQTNRFYTPPDRFLLELDARRRRTVRSGGRPSARGRATAQVEEVDVLRGTLRDLVALSTVEAAWAEERPRDLAARLADVLLSALRASLVYVRLGPAEGETAIEVARVDGNVELDVPGIRAQLGVGTSFDAATPPRYPGLQVATARLGWQGTAGIALVGAPRADFPTERERLLLDIAVNQAALREDRARLLEREKVALAEAEAAQRRLHALFMQAPVPIAVLVGPDHAFELANPAYCAMMDRDDLVGLPLRAAFPEAPYLERVDEVYRTGQSFAAEQLAMALRHRDGTVEDAVFRLLAEPTRTVAGATVGVVLVAVKVTDLVRAREALESALAEKSAAERLREQLFGIVGHDLRGPLSTIVTGARLLQVRGGLAPDAARTIELIQRSGDRMAKMITQLLDYTRAYLGGGIAVERGPTDLASVCADVLAEYNTARPDRVVSVDAASDSGGLWDRERLAQLVANLVGNAIQHGRGDLPIALRLDGRGDTVWLTVHNHGEPIPPSLLPTIFDPFRHGRTTGSGPSGGLGRGLYISREIVRAHGGEIDVLSTAEEGTTFTVRLPRQPTRTEPTPSAQVG